MYYTDWYVSPLGRILLAADGTGLTGLWFEGQKYFARGLETVHEEKNTPVFDVVKRWLDLYFSGRVPDFTPPLRLRGTEFQRTVWKLLQDIPYGETTSYGALALCAAEKNRTVQFSARAVGGAVGRNPISILIPCHRVVGANGSLTGYAGGIERKIKLLRLEGGYKETFFVPPAVEIKGEMYL